MSIIRIECGKFYREACRVGSGNKHPIGNIVPQMPGMLDNPEKQRAAKENDWLQARRNALGLLRVNVSLAIRTAFDAIHHSRVEVTRVQ
ncbi:MULTISPECIES: hypothetical protein [Sinorhizobium]|uniref:hypothetical protein n=1 Tax=Sinorhizobium TaxID=28105 RepID=UPI000ADF521A|nr:MULTISPECIES: hypothetical protein [Sinorhizobium]WOS67071.1 hypothetical protein SFGR64A_30195 [Sinorhizobium fredii GR64]